jgi:nitrate reductase cytochrome c-type subunit
MFFVFPNVFKGGNDMKKIIFPLFILLIFVFACSNSADKEVKPAGGSVAVPVVESKVEKVKSLRGETDIPAGSNPAVGMDWQPEDSSVARTFVHQPPLIPHDTAEYGISTAQNDCLDCHGEEDSDAPMPYKSHYKDRDEKPLVENTFQTK